MLKDMLDIKFIRGFKNFTFLSFGNIISQVISFIGMLFIMNILGTKSYGIYTTAFSFVGFFSLFTLNQMNKVLIREGAEKVEQLGKLLQRYFGLNASLAGISIILCLTAAIFSPYENQLKIYIGILAFDLIFQTFNGYINTIFQVVEKMQYMAFVNILQRVTFVIFAILFLYLGYGILSLILIMLFSRIIILYINYKLSRNFIKFRIRRGINFDPKIMKATMIFSILLFLGYLSYRIDILMISFLRPMEDVGIYGAATKLMDPFWRFFNFISIAFFPVFVKHFKKGQISGKKFFSLTALATTIVLFITIIIIFCARFFIPIFLPKYIQAIPIYSVLVFSFAIHMASSPFNFSLQATHNEWTLLKINWIPPLLNIIGNIILLYYFGLIGIAISTLIVLSTSFLIKGIAGWIVLKKQGKFY